MTDTAAILARHVPVNDGIEGGDGDIICRRCLQIWGTDGCDAHQLGVALEAAFSDFEEAVGKALEASREQHAAIKREARLRAALEALRAAADPDHGIIWLDELDAALATTPASAPVEPTAEGK